MKRAPLVALAILAWATTAPALERHPGPEGLRFTGEPSVAARAYLAAHAEPLKLRNVDLDSRAAFPMHGMHTVRFDQTYAGLPVIGRMVAVRLGPDGSVIRSVLDVARDLHVSPTPSIDAIAARGAVAAAEGVALDPSWSAILAVRPDRHGGKLVWQVDAWGVEGPTRFEVDAHSGAILRSGSLIKHALGRVYEVNKVKTPTPTDKELKNLTSSDPQILAGKAGKVVRYKAGSVETNPPTLTVDGKVVTPNEGENFLYDPPGTEPTFDDSFAETNVYYHLDRMSTWVGTTLGVDTSAAKYSLMAVVNYGPGQKAYDNAAYMPYSMADDDGVKHPNVIVIGQGSKGDFAHDSDVFLHEYTHYLNHNAIGFSQSVYGLDEYGLITTPGTIDEGSADYFSSTVNDDAVVGEASLNLLGPYARDLEGESGTCPDTMYGETHEDGKLIGTAAWAVRKVIGKELSDPMVWAAMSMLPNDGATLGDFAKNVMDAAADLKTQGKVTDAQIAELQKVFDDRGLTECFRSLDTSPTKSRKTNMIGFDILGQMMGASCSMIRQYGVQLTSLFHFKYQPTSADSRVTFKVSMTPIMGGGKDWDWDMYVRRGDMVTFLSNSMTMSIHPDEFDHSVKELTTATGEITIDSKSSPAFDPTQPYDMVIMHRNCPSAEVKVEVVTSGEIPAEPMPEAGPDAQVEEDADVPEEDSGEPGIPATGEPSDDGGCGCRTAPSRSSSWAGVIGLGLAAAAVARSRRRR